MSDSHPTPRTEHTLLGTDDAMVWAEEFCRIFDGHVISPDATVEGGVAAELGGPYVEPGTMVGWFANAMQTAINLYERKKLTAKEEQQEAFVEGFQEGRPD